jgi:hypothetical protein
MTGAVTDRRRHARRLRPVDHRMVSAGVRPGPMLDVIDVSASGLLLEGDCRLVPGACVELHLQSDGRAAEVVRGRVVRSWVARVQPAAVQYRSAIAFEDYVWPF